MVEPEHLVLYLVQHWVMLAVAGVAHIQELVVLAVQVLEEQVQTLIMLQAQELLILVAVAGVQVVTAVQIMQAQQAVQAS